MASLWHTHKPPFEGAHTHEIHGELVAHEHRGEVVVTEDDARWKRPVAPCAGEAITLDVQKGKHGARSRIIG